MRSGEQALERFAAGPTRAADSTRARLLAALVGFTLLAATVIALLAGERAHVWGYLAAGAVTVALAAAGAIRVAARGPAGR